MSLTKPTSIICFECPSSSKSNFTTDVNFDNNSVTFLKSNKKYTCSQVIPDNQSLDDYNKTFKDKLLNTLLDGYNTSLVFFRKPSRCPTSYPCDKIENMIVYQLFDKLKKLSFGKRSYMVTICAMQFKGSQLTDLLNPKDGRSIHISDNGDVVPVTQFVADNEYKLLTFIDQAWKANKELIKNDKSVCVVQINVYQKIEGKSIGIKSTLKLIDMSYLDDNSIATLLKNPVENEATDLQTQFFENVFGGNTVLYLFATINPDDPEGPENKNLSILNYLESLSKLKNKPIINLDESDYLIKQLREQIQQMQETLVDKKPNKLDVQRFEKLLEDLEIHKTQSWPALQRASKVAELERRTNLANKGLAKIFVAKHDDNFKENKKEIESLEKKLNEIGVKFEKQKELVDRLKGALKLKIHEMKGMNGQQKLISEIQKDNETLNREKENLKLIHVEHQHVKRDYDRAIDRQASIGLQGMERFENRWKFEESRLKTIEEENKQLFEEEKAHLENMSEILLAQTMSPEDVVKLKLECGTAIIENELLRKENSELKESMNDLFGGYRIEFEKLSAASFETFREYREYFETHKHEMDIRYRNLLKDAVTDAIFLSSRNDELTKEVKALKQECNRLKDAGALK